MAGLEEYAKSVDEAPIGSKEQEPNDPSDETGTVPQKDRPVYTRFARKHLSLETLREFGVNFDFDTDPEYVLVERWVPEWEQDRLWKHTKIIREKRVESLLKETPDQRVEPQYEWVRKKGMQQTRAPLAYRDVKDMNFLCLYSGCERAVPGNGFPRLGNLQDHVERVHNDYRTFGNSMSQPGERNPSPPPLPLSPGDSRRIHVRTTSRERGTPPSPSSPPLLPFNSLEMTYRYTDTTSGTKSEKWSPQRNKKQEREFTAKENTDMEAREKEYQKRLEDDLRKSGLDEASITAILQKEKIKASEVLK
ncbi:uncharacterized protein FSUBG_13214 [Fusarium subglutinans]|uniref:C2H2-type domain-containing protein n=1 Tax=Gibberella subglutinans TaxID=42677 RepID=A0A8H5L167_GIBSU|nr:uncharacterized protein FSUBG_13214 [Fusarium subglutinans]KAF5583093.1 hypothetical protein FSUBG_13214 [Fusarium subglutinans]